MSLVLPPTINQNPQLLEELAVLPGTLLITNGPAVLWGVIGAGVSVCLWNKIEQIGAMNHFLLPSTRESQKTTGTFGNAAMYGLVSRLTKRSTSTVFESTIVGAAFSDEFEEENSMQLVAVAEEFLWGENIPVMACETGGLLSRHVTFDVESGEIVVRPIDRE